MSSPLRSILVHVDAGAHCTARLNFARSLAAGHDAQVTALMAVSPSFADLPFAYAAGAEAAAVMQSIDDDRRRRGRISFDAANRGEGPQMHWVDAGVCQPMAAFAQAGLCHDLLVVGQNDPAVPTATSGVPPDFVESVVLASGRPVLALPHAGSFERVGDTVLIAWKPSREAARAVDGALPLMRSARQVHVLRAVDGEDDAAAHAEGELEAHLARHGITAPVVRHGRSGPLSGEALLSLAADVGADLLVMGCYGHSRATEWALGGVTRTILRSMTLPTLMAH